MQVIRAAWDRWDEAERGGGNDNPRRMGNRRADGMDLYGYRVDELDTDIGKLLRGME
jgi:hypothetical protein